MGTDIHFFTEIKFQGQWYCYSQHDIGRDYQFFNRLVGVRGCPDNAAFAVKGLPDDLGQITKLHAKRWDADMHHASWLNHNEIIQLYKILEDEFEESFPESNYCGYLFGNGWDCKSYIEELGIEDVRFIFWFDC